MPHVYEAEPDSRQSDEHIETSRLRPRISDQKRRCQSLTMRCGGNH